MKQYLDLLKSIKENGTYKPAAREGMPGTQSLFGYQFRHNLADGFPLLTTKKIFWKGVVVELLWFLRGNTNIKYLLDNGVNIWNEDAYNYYVKCLYQVSVNKNKTPIGFENFINLIKDTSAEDIRDGEPISIPGYRWGSCGHQYGKVWRNWGRVDANEVYYDGLDAYPVITKIDQIQNLINSLKNTPESRRHILTAIDPANDTNLALYWCHAMVQFNCRPLRQIDRKLLLHNKSGWEDQWHMIDEDPSGDVMDICDSEGVPKYYLDCQLYQRSADVVLGVPFNIASYALLTEILCKIANMVPGEFVHTFGDVHIYDNHREAVEEQLKREPSGLPKLKLSNELCNILSSDGLDACLSALSAPHGVEIMAHFQLENYNPQPAIKAELSTGLKK